MEKQPVGLGIVLIGLFIAILSLSFWAELPQKLPPPPPPAAPIDDGHGDGKTYTLFLSPKEGKKVAILTEISDTKAERAYGLINRPVLQNSMLFIFPETQDMDFWAKNVLNPLDIYFFDEKKQFISFATMDPCPANPCKLFSPTRPAKYALETPRGFLGQYKINRNWTMELQQ